MKLVVKREEIEQNMEDILIELKDIRKKLSADLNLSELLLAIMDASIYAEIPKAEKDEEKMSGLLPEMKKVADEILKISYALGEDLSILENKLRKRREER